MRVEKNKVDPVHKSVVVPIAIANNCKPLSKSSQIVRPLQPLTKPKLGVQSIQTTTKAQMQGTSQPSTSLQAGALDLAKDQEESDKRMGLTKNDEDSST